MDMIFSDADELERAIQFFQEKSKKEMKEAESYTLQPELTRLDGIVRVTDHEKYWHFRDLAYQHGQLARWLTELTHRRQTEFAQKAVWNGLLEEVRK